MELQFEMNTIPCLRRDLWQVQDREQTQELRLPEGMPDIGNVIAARGQCVLRSKEWMGESIGVSGGVTVVVLYAPADGGAPKTVEVWVPIQGKWSLPKTRREGLVRASMRLRSCDARTTSARKMMVRVQVSLVAEVLEPWETELAQPPELPADIQLLRRSYPAVLPREAGEKAFYIEEDLSLNSAPERIAYAVGEAILLEQKVVGSRAVFRGNVRVHLLCEEGEGGLYAMDAEVPFSQYTDLDRDYDKETTVDTILAITSFEPELAEGTLRVKCGMLAQYVVCQSRMLEVVEDAYSLGRELTAEMGELELPMVLDCCSDRMHVQTVLGGAQGKVIDSWVCTAHPNVRRAGDLVQLDLDGTAGMLYIDEEGALRGTVNPWNQSWELVAGENVAVQACVSALSTCTVVPEGDGTAVYGDVDVQAQMVMAAPMPMISGLEMGAQKPVDARRPSLILRRSGDKSLWDLAKTCGSTVEAICRANGISAEPMDGRILLIPVN